MNTDALLCASHCNFFEYPQSITGSFIFSLFNFQGPTHFLESFLSVFTEPLSTVRMLLYHTLSCLSTLFSNFFKKFLKVNQDFFCFKSAFLKRQVLLYHAFLQIATPFFKFFKKIFWEFYIFYITTIYCIYRTALYYYQSVIIQKWWKRLFYDTDMTFSSIYIHYIGLNHII